MIDHTITTDHTILVLIGDDTILDEFVFIRVYHRRPIIRSGEYYPPVLVFSSVGAEFRIILNSFTADFIS